MRSIGERAAVGQRIKTHRRRRGLSQVALAGLIGMSESWLSQVERGIRTVDKMSTLLDIANELHVDAESLTGRPWRRSSDGGRPLQDVDPIRRVVYGYRHITGTELGRPVSLPDIRRNVAESHRDYQAANYDAVARRLPELLTSVDSLLVTTNEREYREARLAYTDSYVVGAKLLTKLGVTDLAAITADRAASAAGNTDSLNAQGTATYQVVCALLRSGRTVEAEDLAVRMAERSQRAVRTDNPTLVSVTGALWLIGAVSAARRADRGQAWQRLDVAKRLADLLDRDANYAWTAFGPTNVAIHRVSIATELGDVGEALNAATAVDVDTLPAKLKSRRAQVNIDLAWAQTQRRLDAEATLNLLEAERAAPQSLRCNVTAQEMIRDILARDKRGTTNSLTRLAERVGVLH